MKKNIYKILAAACAFTIIIASPAASITTHALGFNIDAGYDDGGDMDSIPDDYWDNLNDGGGSSNDSGSSSEPSYEEPSYTEPSYTEPSQPASDSGSSNSSSGSDNGSHDSSSSNSGSSTAASNTSVSNAAVPGTAKKAANDVTVSVTGGQKFRSVMNADHTVYQVYHCGISRASFTVTNAEGNVVAFSTATLEKGEDGLWYVNITFAGGVDTTGFTVTATAGDATYLSTSLGVSGIKVNGTVALSTVPVTEAK